MRAQFLRADRDDLMAGVLSRSRYLMRAYQDLTWPHGPLHARTVADAGHYLAAGEPIPTYQINTPSVLREWLAAEPGGADDPKDPRDVPETARSARWELLCAMLDEWPARDLQERVRVATVLTKLGFWETVASLIPPDLPVTDSAAHARLAQLRCNALVKMRGDLSTALPNARYVLCATAGHPRIPAMNRLQAVINLIVHHSKTDKSLPQMRYWATAARTLMAKGAAASGGPVLVSAYWRAVSLVPFFENDHATVRGMLDECEEAARAAISDPSVPRLLAEENLFPVLETRGRSARAAGDLDSAEHYYRALVQHDPEEGRAHIALGDLLLLTERWGQARSSYEMAASLGVPYIAYACTQAARCSYLLDEPERAVAALTQAIQADPRAVTPVVALRNIARFTNLAHLSEWCESRVNKAVHRVKVVE